MASRVERRSARSVTGSRMVAGARAVTMQVRQSLEHDTYNAAVLVGRQAELAHLTDLLRGDHPVVVLGEAGIGKTALLHAALEADARRAFVGGALATLSWMEYFPLARALGQRRLDGDVATVARRVREAVGDDGLLVIDDLQWADAGTIGVLELLVQSVRMAVTLRTGESGSDELADRLRDIRFMAIDAVPLPDDQASALVRALRPETSEVAVQRLVRRCGGVPLLLTQLAGPEGEASESLRISLASRLRQLSPAAFELFGLLAIIGHPVEASDDERAALAELVRANLVVVRVSEVEVAHALLAELAVERLPDDEQRQLHRRAATRVADPGQAARHAEAAGDRDEAHRLAMVAADAAADRPTEAATHLAVAARCARGARGDELRFRAAEALTSSLRHADADAVLDEIVGRDPATRARRAIIRSRTSWYRGDDDAFRSAIDEAVEAGKRAGPQLNASALVERSRRAIFLDPDFGSGGLAMAKAGLAAAREAGIPIARAEMLSGLASYMVDRPDWRVGLDRALGNARASGDIDTELATANNLITAHESSGDPQLGRKLAEEMIGRTGRMGLVGWQLQFRAMLLNLDLHAADYLGAVSQAVELLDEPIDARARGQIESSLAICLIDLGRIDLAKQRLADIEDGPHRDLVGLDTIRWLQAEAELHGGRPAAARDLARESIALGMADPFPAIVERWALVDLGQDPGGPLDAHPMPLFGGLQPESLGLVEMSRGDADEALRHFDEAAALWRIYHRRGEFRSRWAAAEAARRAGDEEDARRRLLELEADLGPRQMLPMLARVHRSMRVLGMRRSAPHTRRSATEMTDREMQVMRLVAGGMTNAEIGRRLGISRSTVTGLVGSAMSALGATSRGQAAALLAW